MNAVRRKFSPEFVNRIDSVITYRPLDAKALATIVDQQIEALRAAHRQSPDGTRF